MKLKKKFILIFIFISIIPILTFSVYTFSRYTSLVERQTAQTAQNLMDVAAAQANAQLDTLEHIVEAMYLTREDGSSMVDNLKQYTSSAPYTTYDIYHSNEKLKYICQDFVYFFPYINGIFLFTPDGPTLGFGYGNGNNVTSDYVPTEEEWYQDTVRLAGETYVFGPSEKSFIEGSPSSISFCNALYDVYTREFLGVLFIDCSPEIFDLSSVNSLPDTASLTVKKENAILYRTAAKEIPGEHQQTLTFSQDLQLSGLTLEAQINQSLLSREFGITQITLVALSVVCIVGILILSVFLSRSIIAPIIHLSSQMLNRDGNQNVSSSRYFHYGDEIGTLYNSYQEMLDERNYYIKHELENKLIVLDSQMRALETQINAHFLYNTLESINSIAVKEKVSDISTMALALGSMFRYSIKTKSELVPLSAELKNVQDYADIQLLRYDHAFSLKMEIPDDLKDRKVLKLILQPLVENALYHGLNHCLSGDEISVTARAERSLLLLSVTDNGQGIPPDKLEELNAKLKQKAQFTELGKRRNTSIGIKNINTRIALYYGEAYGLNISSIPNAGTTVLITLPLLD